MKDHKPFKVKLLRTIRNGRGDVFRKGSNVMARKRYGGYELTKSKRRANGCVISVTWVKANSFAPIKIKP